VQHQPGLGEAGPELVEHVAPQRVLPHGRIEVDHVEVVAVDLEALEEDTLVARHIDLRAGCQQRPIGGALGFSPVTHRGIIAAITPIAIPGGNAQQLKENLIRQLKDGGFNIFQLDATAYPGNSGGPMFDPETGEVIGIINMVFVKGSKEAALSQPSGISYAIPANFLRALLGN
jgi:S1-C subfamily serine protease